MNSLRSILLLLCVSALSLAQDPIGSNQLTRIPDPKAPEFRFIGYWFTRATMSNVSPTNDLLQGQIIGRMFGSNTTNTGKTSNYIEQRFVPMFIYSPQILDGVATFRSLFKIDMTWGDVAYGVGGNRGGSINAGQINLQTLLANVDIHPTDATWNVVIGLQRIFDNPRDPNMMAVSTAQSSAYKLAYWGTQGVGISYFQAINYTTMLRLGYYQLYENVVSENDDVSLWMLDAETRIAPRIEVGANAWFLWDRGKSAGGVSVLGQGLNSNLSEYNGGPRYIFPTSTYEANIGWLGARAAYNRDFTTGRLWADGFVMSNIGTVDTVGAGTAHFGNILGFAANATLYYKYGMTVNDRVQAELMYTTGDKDMGTTGNGADDGKMRSVLTGNVYGSPTAIYSNHRSLLLFPDPKVVNRYFSAVHDISNMGYGMTGLFGSVSHDFIPNKLTTKIGLAKAISVIKPVNGGVDVGTELNTEVTYTYKVFLSFGLSAGYVWLGDFYNSSAVTYDNKRPSQNPWVVFAHMSWLMF